MTDTPIIQLRDLGKRFYSIEALANIDLHIQPGTIHAVVGENGAGKSTLGKIIGGLILPDQGEMLVHGRTVRYRSPAAAIRDGITMISQELTLVPQRSVIDNVFLGMESNRHGFVHDSQMRLRYRNLVGKMGFDLPPERVVSDLAFADQKLVEILRAIARGSRVIIMDEPTASLSSQKSEALLEIIQRLKEDGTTVIYISHYLAEVLRLADEITILRNGRLVRTSPASQETDESLVEAMIGTPISTAFPAKKYPREDSPTVLRVKGLCRKNVLHDISFDIKAGEILGLAGLVGSGRSELAKVIFGADPKDAGVIDLHGQPARITCPRTAIRAGIGFLPESRKSEGLIMIGDVGFNITLPHLDKISHASFVNAREEDIQVRKVLQDLDVRPPEPRALVNSLSGGNQQKALFGKWLFQRPRLLIADEPTSGIDVGAKRSIYKLLASLAEEGMAILLISSDLNEVIGLSHRVLCMRLGRIVGEFAGDFIAEDSIMRAIFAAGKQKENAL